MKYLIMEDFAGQPVPFLFPNRVDHADLRDQLPYSKVLGAGYISLLDGHFYCEGGNTELKASARIEDADIIRKALTASDKD